MLEENPQRQNCSSPSYASSLLCQLDPWTHWGSPRPASWPKTECPALGCCSLWTLSMCHAMKISVPRSDNVMINRELKQRSKEEEGLWRFTLWLRVARVESVASRINISRLFKWEFPFTIFNTWFPLASRTSKRVLVKIFFSGSTIRGKAWGVQNLVSITGILISSIADSNSGIGKKAGADYTIEANEALSDKINDECRMQT